MSEEIWKDIYFIENGTIWDYRGLYKVSNEGRVKSLEKIDKSGHLRQEKIMNNINSNGYKRIGLRKNNKQKYFSIHRLVAHMFLDGYFDGAEVDHIDTDPSNNRVDNLRWVTRKENQNNPLTKEHISKSNTGISKTDEHKQNLSKNHANVNGKNNPNIGKLIDRYTKDGTYVDTHYNFEYVQMGFLHSSISHCCSGKQSIHKGFIFKYHNEIE